MINILNIIKNTTKILISVIIILIIIFLVYRKMMVTQTFKEHIITSENGIDEELNLDIGGIKQHLYIRGQDVNNPIILFLHGGPGGAMTSMLHTYQYQWENNYTVVNWDQRNAGKTYFLNKEQGDEIKSTLSPDIMVEDIHEIVDYLTKRFNHEKVIIMGHSWGTVIGSQFALKYPELVQAYIGVGQVVDVNDGMIKMAEYIQLLANEHKDSNDVQTMDSIIGDIRTDKVFDNSHALNISSVASKYVTTDMDSTIFLRNMIMSPYFSIKELSYFLKMDELQKPLTDYLVDYDLRELNSNYNMPVIYILGENDWSMKLLAAEYFKTIEAPYKKYIVIKDSGHVTMMNKPDEFFNSFHEALQEY